MCPTTDNHAGAPSLAYTDLAYYGVWGLGDDIKRKSKKEERKKGTGARGEVHTREPKYRLRSKLVTSLCPLVARVSYELANEEIRYGNCLYR